MTSPNYCTACGREWPEEVCAACFTARRGKEGDGEMGEKTASWRDAQIAKVCGDKKIVVCIRPSGHGSWLYLERTDDIVDWLIGGEPGDEWELKWVLMTQAEIDAMPEHDGW